jgi:hypothetical protein
MMMAIARDDNGTKSLCLEPHDISEWSEWSEIKFRALIMSLPLCVKLKICSRNLLFEVSPRKLMSGDN